MLPGARPAPAVAPGGRFPACTARRPSLRSNPRDQTTGDAPDPARRRKGAVSSPRQARLAPLATAGRPPTAAAARAGAADAGAVAASGAGLRARLAGSTGRRDRAGRADQLSDAVLPRGHDPGRAGRSADRLSADRLSPRDDGPAGQRSAATGRAAAELPGADL